MKSGGLSTRPHWGYLVGSAVVTLVVMSIAVAAYFLQDTTSWALTADPLGVAKLPPYVGFVSNVGVLAWCVGAAISLFAGVLGRRRLPHGDHPVLTLLTHAGVLTTLLCLDNVFMIHEYVAPTWLGLPEEVVLGTLALLGVGLLVGHRRTVLRTDVTLLGTALLAFFVMVVVDLLEGNIQIFAHHLWEDGAKKLGILCWSSWLIVLARSALLPPTVTARPHGSPEQPGLDGD